MRLKYFTNDFYFLRVYNSPFKPLKLNFYCGKIALGTPYFYPRKWVKGTPKLINDFLNVSTSLIATDRPKPTIGPISGEINIAPITTAVLLTFKPIEATNTENIKIQAL